MAQPQVGKGEARIGKQQSVAARRWTQSSAAGLSSGACGEVPGTRTSLCRAGAHQPREGPRAAQRGLRFRRTSAARGRTEKAAPPPKVIELQLGRAGSPASPPPGAHGPSPACMAAKVASRAWDVPYRWSQYAQQGFGGTCPGRTMSPPDASPRDWLSSCRRSVTSIKCIWPRNHRLRWSTKPQALTPAVA